MKTKGFTLLEVILSILILLILMTLSVIVYAYFARSSELKTASQHLEGTLREAQGRSISGVSNQVWGVYLENKKYVLFKGEIYNPTDLDNQTNPLASGLSLSWNLSPSTSSVIFEKLNGVPRSFGSISISGPFNQSETILINEVGKIELQ